MYNKLFTKILDSSIWTESVETRIVWLTFIAAMDEHGFVAFASVKNVAMRANVSLDAATEACRILESPDHDSSDPDHEGRRVERVPGGWMVLNAGKYRAMVTRTEVQTHTRERVARHRAKKSQVPCNASVTACNAPVTACNAPVTACNVSVTQSEAEAKTEADGTCIAHAHVSGEIDAKAAAEIDAIRADHAAEERRLTENLLAIRDAGEDVQTVLDSVAEPRRKPFSAYQWLRNGRSGVPETSGGVTVLRLLNAALEARQRAQDRPVISDSMSQTLESLRRSGERIKARMAAERKLIA